MISKGTFDPTTSISNCFRLIESTDRIASATLGSEIAQAVAQSDTNIDSQYMYGLEGLLVGLTPSEQINRVLSFAKEVTKIFNSNPGLRRLLVDPKGVFSEKEAVEQINLYRKLANLIREQADKIIENHNGAVNPKRFSVTVNSGVKTIEYTLQDPPQGMNSLESQDPLKLFEKFYLFNIADQQSKNSEWRKLWKDHELEMTNARLAGHFPIVETSKIINDYIVFAAKYGRRLYSC